MKKVKLLIVLFVVLTVTSFSVKSTDHTRSKNDFDTAYAVKEKNEIIGIWIKSNGLENSKNSIDNNIIEINFKKNLTAQIKVSDSIGTRTITGKWSTEKTENYKKVIEPMVGKKIEPDVILEYLRNGKGLNIISFSKEITENGIRLKSAKATFEKK